MHQCGKKGVHWINEFPDIPPEKREHIDKDRAERWAKKNGHNNTQVVELVNVLDADLEMESCLSMLVPGKNAFGDNR